MLRARQRSITHGHVAANGSVFVRTGGSYSMTISRCFPFVVVAILRKIIYVEAVQQCVTHQWISMNFYPAPPMDLKVVPGHEDIFRAAAEGVFGRIRATSHPWAAP